MGQLFILNKDNTLRAISHQKLFDKYLYTNTLAENELLIKLLFKNDSLHNKSTFDYDESYRTFFDNFWHRMSNKVCEIQLDVEDFKVICELPEKGALDFVLYGERAYLGNRDGLFECQLGFNDDRVSLASKGFNRVFDSKTIGLNPRIGNILVSARDGLFLGAIVSREDRTNVNKDPIDESSLRTGWAQYNFVNYKSSTDASFFVNKVEEQKETIGINFSVDDGSNRNMKITEIGSEKRSLTKTIEHAAPKDDVIYTFNSLGNSFAITRKGNVLFSRFKDDLSDRETLSEFKPFRGISFDLDDLGFPLSGHVVQMGTVVEFFDKVFLIRYGVIEQISNFECRQVRTFPSSKWFKNIALTISEDCFEIHTVHPYL
ncbi:hypothetical protein [Nubsella zeaxanthinifaciens]|uniref:hypothetical protein n=1 Tax=Nubsella zeaxanthinifaciens TaxID=392412 RepID=UPI000DE27926|nr:hypothetical protein [Nubsella zeaxanthinifaciens]